MKNLTFFRKLGISLNLMYTRMILTFMGIMIFFCMIPTIMNAADPSAADAPDNFSNSLMTFNLSINMGLLYVFSVSFVAGNSSLLKVMPMTHRDISDVMTITSVMITIFMALPVIALNAVMGDFTLIPYYLCCFCVWLGMSSFFIPWCMKDRSAYDSAEAAAKREQEGKKGVAKKAAVMCAYMISSGIAGMIILDFGRYKPDITAHMPVLIGVSLLFIAVFTAVSVYCKRLKGSFMR